MTALIALVIDDGLQKRNSGVDAGDMEGSQGLPGFVDSLIAIGAMDDQLGQQRIIIGRHEVTGVAVAVDPNARAIWSLPVGDATGTGAETVLRRFGVDAAFDGVAGYSDIRLLQRQRLAAGDQ